MSRDSEAGRGLFTAEHERFRQAVSTFVDDEVMPHYTRWEQEGHFPREVFARLGELGVMGVALPEKYGGSGRDDFRYNVVLQEEASRRLVTLGTVRTQLDVILPYFLTYADDDQRTRWFPGLAAGRLLTAIAMTEPGTGSDLAGIRTTAVRDGDTYVVNGAKTFITGGLLADLVIVVARTGRDPGDRRAGLTMLVVEDGMPGFGRGRKLDKLGIRAQDTVELSFDDVRVPVANRLGEEGSAFACLGHNLPQERMTVAVGSVAQSRAVLDATVSELAQRDVVDQHTKFELAAVHAELEAAQALCDRSVRALVERRLDAAEAAATKLFCTEAQARAVDRCLQLWGDVALESAHPVSRMWADARVTRIYAGTSEVMKLIVAKSLGL